MIISKVLKKRYSNSVSIFQITEEFRLKSELYEAQITKAKVEKAELSADFNRERLEMQKQHLDAKKEIEILLTQEDNLKEQIEHYETQYESMAKVVLDKRFQMDDLNKKLKNLESDRNMWKEKFEESKNVVIKMNTANANSDIELEAIKRKLDAMVKLNKVLQNERSQLLKQAT